MTTLRSPVVSHSCGYASREAESGYFRDMTKNTFDKLKTLFPVSRTSFAESNKLKQITTLWYLAGFLKYSGRIGPPLFPMEVDLCDPSRITRELRLDADYKDLFATFLKPSTSSISPHLAAITTHYRVTLYGESYHEHVVSKDKPGVAPIWASFPVALKSLTAPPILPDNPQTIESDSDRFLTSCEELTAELCPLPLDDEVQTPSKTFTAELATRAKSTPTSDTCVPSQNIVFSLPDKAILTKNEELSRARAQFDKVHSELMSQDIARGGVMTICHAPSLYEALGCPKNCDAQSIRTMINNWLVDQLVSSGDYDVKLIGRKTMTLEDVARVIRENSTGSEAMIEALDTVKRKTDMILAAIKSQQVPFGALTCLPVNPMTPGFIPESAPAHLQREAQPSSTRNVNVAQPSTSHQGARVLQPWER